MARMTEYLEEEGDESENLMLIFVKMKRTAWKLEQRLKSFGFDVVSIHGDKSQKVTIFQKEEKKKKRRRE